MINNNLYFHETFQPEMPYIAKLLELSIDGFTGDKFKISGMTGIPTGKEKGKVEPHIKYAKYMGMIEYSCERGIYSLSATPLGREVWNQDKYLHEVLSGWLLHYCISRKREGAPQWIFLTRVMNNGFNSEMSQNFLFSGAQKEFAISCADVSKAFGVVKSSYLSGCFANLYYLCWDEKITFEEKSEQLEFCYLYAYALIDSWDSEFPDKKEITFHEILETLSFGKVFGLNDKELDSILCTLEEKGLISINRQLFPVTVVRTTTVNEIIPHIYSMLM